MKPPLFLLTGLIAIAAAPPSELKDPSGNTIIKYVAEPPGAVDPAHPLGLILCFPEHDRPVGDEIYPVREALTRLGIRDQYLILAGGPQERKFGPQDYVPISKLIEWAKKTYPINPRRVYMYGKGEGGKISGEMTMFNPNVVTASISYSWSWWKMPAEIDKAIDPVHSAPEIYMVLGLRDLSYHLTNVRDGFSRVNAKGYPVIFREFDDLGARTYHPASNDDAIAWAHRLRNKNLPLSAAEKKLLAAPKIGAKGYYEDLALVGGAAAGEVLKRLLESPDEKVRASAAATFANGIFGESAAAALGERLTDKSAIVRHHAVRGLAMLANWRSQAAQNALTNFLASPSAAVAAADRVSVASAIVQAARLQLLGVRQDARLFQALVAMTSDENEEIRTIGNNTLMPIRDREFRGDSGRRERKEPEGGWAAWLEGVTARAAGYRRDYANCKTPANEAAALFCQGGAYLLGYDPATGKATATDPRKAFALTLEAAQKGYHPAEAMAGMMYVVGKGVEQNNPEGAMWLAKAADAGDTLAATNAAILYKGSPGLRANPELGKKYTELSPDLRVIKPEPK